MPGVQAVRQAAGDQADEEARDAKTAQQLWKLSAELTECDWPREFCEVNVPVVAGSVRPSPVFLAVVAITAARVEVFARRPPTIQPLAYVGVFTLVIAGWVVLLGLHQFAHAYTAFRFGDHGVAMRGYLTLNPLKYTHPVLCVPLIPIVFIALGGVHRRAGRGRVRADVIHDQEAEDDRQPRRAVHQRRVRRGPARGDGAVLRPGPGGVLGRHGVLRLPARATAAWPNSLPVPGLDGYGALEPHLSPDTQRALAPAKTWGCCSCSSFLFIASPLGNYFFAVVTWFVDLFGVKRFLVGNGLRLTQFWSAWL